MSVLVKRMSSSAHKKALWTVDNVRGQNDEENWGMLHESGSSSCSECILRSTLAILTVPKGGWVKCLICIHRAIRGKNL